MKHTTQTLYTYTNQVTPMKGGTQKFCTKSLQPCSHRHLAAGGNQMFPSTGNDFQTVLGNKGETVLFRGKCLSRVLTHFRNISSGRAAYSQVYVVVETCCNTLCLK